MHQKEYHPSISVVIASYNSSKTIKQTIKSFIDQTYSQKELIIIDGGSTDGTIDIIKLYDRHVKYWISEPDSGVYNAWNKALLKTSGEWFCFMGSDDYLWDKNVLSNLYQKLNYASYLKINIVYGRIALLNTTGQLISILGNPWEETKMTMLKYMSIPHPGLMHNRSMVINNGLFDEKFKIAGDYEFLLRELKNNNNALFIPEIITLGMRTGGLSKNQKNKYTILKEEFLARYKNRINPINYHWLKRFIYVFVNDLYDHIYGENSFGRFRNRLKTFIKGIKYR